jgi:hypothetical protein
MYIILLMSVEPESGNKSNAAASARNMEAEDLHDEETRTDEEALLTTARRRQERSESPADALFRSSNNSSFSFNWRIYTGLCLLILILSGYIAAITLYSGKTASTRDRPFYSAEGFVTGASHPELPNNFNDLPKIRVQKHGAVGDGITLDTSAFQNAIQAANVAGGGVVVVESGRFLIGNIDLLSNTYLYVGSDAVIVASSREEDYPYPDSWESSGDIHSPDNMLPVSIRCKQQSRVGVIGNGGTIDGSAVPAYVDGYNVTLDKYIPHRFRNESCLGECRPRLLLFEKCTNIVVSNVTLQNSPDWTLHVRGSSEVLLENLEIRGDWRWPNNDGIDVDSSVNVTIRNNTILTADDGLCVKSTPNYGETSNVLMESNIVQSRSSAFKIGSATVEDVHDIYVNRLYILSNSNRALGIQHRDEGNVYNIHFRNVVVGGLQFQTDGWWGNAEPVYVSSVPRRSGDVVGEVFNITIQDYKAYDVANGVFLSSVRGGKPLVNISFVNAHMMVVQYPREWKNNMGRLSPQVQTGVQYSSAQRDYRPTDAMDPQLVPVSKVDAVYLEGVDISTAVCRGSSVTFVRGAGGSADSSGQEWWGDCFGGQAMGKTQPFHGLKCIFGGSPL